MEHSRWAPESARIDAVPPRLQVDGTDLDHGGPNNHLALVYEDRAAQFATAIPFVREGLERGERCLYVVDDNTRDTVVDAMEDAGIDVAAAREAGLLSLHSREDTYLRNGAFDPADMIAGLNETVTEAVEEQGFEHVRFTGEMTWVLGGDGGTDRDELAAYEAKVNDHVPGEAVTGLCQYNRNRFSEAVLDDVVRTHPQLVYDEGLWQNFWYVPPERFFDERWETGAFDQRLETLLPLTDGAETDDAGVEALTAASRELRSSDPAAIGEHVLGNARDVLDTDRVAICLYGEETGELEPCSTVADGFDPDRFEDDLWGAFVTNETRVLDGERGDAATAGEDVVVVPLSRHGVFVAAADAGSVGDADVTFAETVGANVRATLDRTERETVLDDPGGTAMTERIDRLSVATDVAGDVVRPIVDASSRAEIRRTVCERLADVDGWRLAWVGTTNATSEQVVERAAAGAATSYLDDVSVGVTDDPATEPAGRAAATRSTQVVDDVRDDGASEGWGSSATDRGLRSVASVPVVYEGVSYGVLNVYGAAPGAFGELERRVLENLGRAVAFACNALERREALVSDRATELDLRVPDDPAFVSFVSRTHETVTVEGIVPQDGGDGEEADLLQVFFTAPEGARAAVESAAEESTELRSSSLVSERDGGLLYDVTVTEAGLLGTLLDHAAVPESFTGAGDGGRVVVRVPPSTDVASFVAMLDDRYPDTELRARQAVERTRESRHGFRSRLEEALTDRQWDTLQTAYLSGYFEWPREQSGQEVGARLDVSQPTFNRHLRDGLRKVLTPIFDDETSGDD